MTALRTLFSSLYFLLLPCLLVAYPSQVIILSYAECNSFYNLTPEGIERSGLLPGYLNSLTTQGFGPPDIIFGAQRSESIPGFAIFQTATPSSYDLQIPIHVHSPIDIPGLVNTVLNNPICQNKCVLIIWNFTAIPDLIAAFGYQTPSSPSTPCNALTYILPTLPATPGIAPTVLNQDLMAGDSSCGGIAPPTPPAPNAVANYIPITVYNGTTSAIINGVASPIADTQIYVLVQTNSGTQVLQFAPDGSGNMLGTPITAFPTNGNGASFYSSYFSYALNAFPSAASGFYTFYLPATIEQPSSRILFSLINPIDWLITPSTGQINSQDDNFSTTSNSYYTLYDKVEFTITHASLPWWQIVMNSTMVDYYCLPLSFYVNYLNSSVSTTSYTGLSPTLSRQSVFANYQTGLTTLASSGSGTWSTLYTSYIPVGTSSAVNLRIASANSAALKPTIGSPLFPANYLASNPNATCDWLPSIWFNSSAPPYAFYQTGGSNTLTVDLSNAGAGSGTALGQVNGSGEFVFTLNSDSIWYPGTVTFQSPQTIAPFFSGAYTDYVNPSNSAPLWSISGGATTDTITAIWQIFSCAFSVGYIPPTSPIGTPSSPLTKAWLQSQSATYFNDNPALCSGPWYNFYSKILHENCSVAPYTDFYTAPFDDYLGIDGTITVDDTTGVNAAVTVNITIGDMTNSVIPNILSDSTQYNVSFAILPGSVQNVTFNGSAVPSGGGSMGTAAGSSMTIALQYTTGSYSTSPSTTFTAQVSPSTATTTPILPGGANIILAGNDVTIYLGSAPP